ncbi:hypothetical protein F4805DRAFT_452074 [Annulohypoxylon moriforme]|nr:hypothetical protein F4805DRAFT_452074 [Annulohypoxylon moriforme]
MTPNNYIEQSPPEQTSSDGHPDPLPSNERLHGENRFILPNKKLMSRELYGTCAFLTPKSRIRSFYFVSPPAPGYSTGLQPPSSDMESISNSEEPLSEKGEDDEKIGDDAENLMGKLQELVKGLCSVFCDQELWVYILLALAVIVIMIVVLNPDSVLRLYTAGYQLYHLK